eukprot:1151352-Pelagomonas_calceolata.AAC.5
MGTLAAVSCAGTATARGGTSSVMAPLAELAALLMRVDQFYDSIGGLVGYQAKSIELILEGTGEQQPQQAQEEVCVCVCVQRCVPGGHRGAAGAGAEGECVCVCV